MTNDRIQRSNQASNSESIKQVDENREKFISRNKTYFEGYYVVHDMYSSNATLVSTRSSM